MNLFTLPTVIRLEPVPSATKVTRLRRLFEGDLYAPWLKTDKTQENAESQCRHLNLETGTTLTFKVHLHNPLKMPLKLDRVELLNECSLETLSDSHILQPGESDILVRACVKRGPTCEVKIRGLRVHVLGTYCDHLTDRRGFSLMRLPFSVLKGDHGSLVKPVNTKPFQWDLDSLILEEPKDGPVFLSLSSDNIHPDAYGASVLDVLEGEHYSLRVNFRSRDKSQWPLLGYR